MASVKLAYGSQATYMGDTSLQNFASSTTAGKQGSVVDNSTDLYDDYLVQIKIVTASSPAAANDKAIYVYAAGAIDASSPVYAGMPAASGTEGSYTFDDANYNPLALLGIVPVTAVSKTYVATFGVAAAFGGMCPIKWVPVVRNYGGVTTSNTAGDNWLKAQGVYYTVA